MEKTWADLDGWVKILGALGILAGAMAVPFSGTLKEWWSYKLRRIEIDRLSVPPAEAVRAMGPEAIGLSLLGSDLVKAMENIHTAITDLANAVRADTASDERRNNDRLHDALETLVEKIETLERGRHR